MFFPEQAFGYAQAEWAKRKARLSGIDHERSLNRVLSFYETFKPVVLEVLQSRLPIWASPHREHFERLRAEVGFVTIFQTMTGEVPVECLVSLQPVVSKGKDHAQSTRSRTKPPSTRMRSSSQWRGSKD